VDPSRVEALVRAHTEGPALGVLGRDRINVLALNLALDESLGRTR
jgi:K+-transporting ATPase ATPase C chain